METTKRPARVGRDYKEFKFKGEGYHITGYTEKHVISATVTIFGKMSEEERDLPLVKNLVIALGELVLRLEADQEEVKP